MQWLGSDSLVAGGADHFLKVYDLEKLAIQESIFTHHKVITAMDTSCASGSHIVLGGQEDGVVKLFDLRARTLKTASQRQFAAHSRYISSVTINPQAENVFLTSAYDGKLKLWDMRNEAEPIAVLKHNSKIPQQTTGDFKLFTTCWNGPSEILSGGSDSHVSVHEIPQ